MFKTHFLNKKRKNLVYVYGAHAVAMPARYTNLSGTVPVRVLFCALIESVSK